MDTPASPPSTPPLGGGRWVFWKTHDQREGSLGFWETHHEGGGVDAILKGGGGVTKERWYKGFNNTGSHAEYLTRRVPAHTQHVLVPSHSRSFGDRSR